MGPFLIAWLVGMGLNISHEAYSYKVLSGTGPNTVITQQSPLPPKPGRMLIASGIYVGLAVLAEAPSMRSTATLAAWGYNIAIGLRWAQEYTTDKAGGIKAGGTSWWSPPLASSDVVYPNGTGGSPNAKPTSAASSTTGTGTQVA